MNAVSQANASWKLDVNLISFGIHLTFLGSFSEAVAAVSYEEHQTNDNTERSD